MKKYLRLIILFVVTFFLVFQIPDDPDLGLHLRVGEYILNNHTIPRTDLFSFSLPNHAYVYHSWLSAVGMALIYRVSGFWGLTLTANLCIAIGCLVILRRCQWSLLFVLVYLVVTSIVFSSIGVRPQVVSFLFFTVLVYLVFPKRDKRVRGEKGDRKIWLVPLLFLLWANLHAGFVSGLLLLLAFGLSESIKQVVVRLRMGNWFRATLEPQLPARDLVFLGVVIIFTLLATLINPYGLDLYKAVLAISTNPFNTRYNLEWVPLLSRTPIHVGMAAVLFMYFVGLMVFRLPIDLTEVSLTSGFFFLGMRSVRAILFFFILFLPMVSHYLARIKIPRIKFVSFSPVPVATLALVLAIVYRGMTNTLTSVATMTDERFLAGYRQHYPYGAVQYIKNHAVPPRLLNHYAWGGYLLWQLPGRRQFETGIMDVFQTRSGRYFLADYFEIINLGPSFQARMAEYQIDGILLTPEAPLVQYVRQSAEWEILYEDEGSVLATRKR